MAFAPSLRVFRHRAYRNYWIMRQLMTAGRQMRAVAIGWQVYDLARLDRSVEESAFLLGLVGLVQFLPVLALSLVGGQAADRFDRKRIILASNIVGFAANLLLIATAFLAPQLALPLVFVAAAVLGGVNAFFPAAGNALYPNLVPRAELSNAIAWNSLGFQSFAIAGPALGGFLYAAGAHVVYSISALMSLLAFLVMAVTKTPKQEPIPGADGFKMAMEGLRFVRDNKTILGAVLLDLIVVFFAGATALLPVFARDILHVGAGGLGLLRAAPAAGAAVVAFSLATRPLQNKVGRTMLVAIVVYGAATLVFASSTAFWLSMAALAVTGAADMISVYVRQSLIQFATPDAMRGRVSAVSFIFISASNELGEFESGVAARFLGPVGAVVLGGTVAIATAIAWIRLFPSLANADRLDAAPQVVTQNPERIEPRAQGAPPAS
ncbi:MAG: MFS transporter [Parvularculaceae bacterium]|nr:MFS transporter [Parvularculaceae bacterium]